MQTAEVENPDFTIVTPSYNYGCFIRDCLESVATQEGVTYEHLVFDAGSTDDTLEILKNFPHVKVVVEPDNGMSEAINKGFRAAKGKWVMWLNTDDVLLPGALKSVKDFSAKYPDADVIYGAWNFVDENGCFQRKMKALPYHLNMLIWYGTYLASTSLFLKRATTIDEGFLLNERFRFNMDGEYYVRLGKAGKKFINLNKPLANFRWHGNNLSARNTGKKDMDMEFRRQDQLVESGVIRRYYGKFSCKRVNYNFLLDGIVRELYRYRKGVVGLFTPWIK